MGDDKVNKKCEVVETESNKRTRRSFLKNIVIRARLMFYCQRPVSTQRFVMQNAQRRKQC